jgi:osmoprotectant transport system ATP-binding protein
MIHFEHVWKTYPGDVHAVCDLSLHVEEGETLVLLGTSGSGKTTTMKMVNRLIEPTRGAIRVGGEDITQRDAIALRREIGYAIQHIGLFPHMTIAGNIAVVPRLLGWDHDRVRARADELLRLVGLEPDEFRDRYPAQLSGGQKQRIGVARALAANPPIVLMDEPFGALDPITREQLQDEFLDLVSEIRKTILFVTHDVFEAVKMGDRVALLHEGRLQQLARPAELVEKPANAFVDHFLGQHRFQLSLLTRTLRTVSLEEASDPAFDTTQPHLQLRHSMVEALDLFKKTGRGRLAVCRRNTLVGYLRKAHLLETITDALGDVDGSEAEA